MNPGWVVQPSLEVCAAQCGSRCCKGPGYIALTPDEAVAHFPTDGFLMSITNAHGHFHYDQTGRVYIPFIMFPGDQCPHLDDDGACRIYEDRPSACRGFPEAPHPGCLVWPTA